MVRGFQGPTVVQSRVVHLGNGASRTAHAGLWASRSCVLSGGRQVKPMPPLRDDTLLTLQQACDYGFAGGASPATLKHEWSLGNLELSKIGRSYFTTPAKLKAMEAKCLAEPPARNSGSTKEEEPGRSSTAEAAAARDSLMTKLETLRKPSADTSRRSTSLRTVRPLTSQT